MDKPKVIVICGPTASGKTSLSISLAKKINGEIVSCDSMQIYKEMDIGSAKPTVEEMQEIKHYLVDFVSPEKRYSVSEYKEDASKAIEEIINKGKTPIIVGGTGLYLNSLIYNIQYNEMEVDLNYRRELEKEAEEYGLEVLYNRAKEIDPEAMEKVSANDKKRITRVLEIFPSKNSFTSLYPNPCIAVGILEYLLIKFLTSSINPCSNIISTLLLILSYKILLSILIPKIK